jgi:hypothetical protein
MVISIDDLIYCDRAGALCKSQRNDLRVIETGIAESVPFSGQQNGVA